LSIFAFAPDPALPGFITPPKAGRVSRNGRRWSSGGKSVEVGSQASTHPRRPAATSEHLGVSEPGCRARRMRRVAPAAAIFKQKPAVTSTKISRFL